jgi:stearoyl-CoA desaturase (delta-9 desaturase)
MIANIAVTGAPFLLVALAAVKAWDGWLHWQDLVVFTVMYVPVGLGVTVGYHRLFTHRSFKTSGPMRAVWGVLGSASVEGPVIEWVAYHRKHHAFADDEGDPHSPHVGNGSGWRGALAGLWHAHMGWVWFSDVEAEEARYAPDLLQDRVVRMVDRLFLVWVLLGLALPFGLGVALTGTVFGGLTALLWGGAVRIFLCHQLSFSVNSLCHFFGHRDYATDDESRNLAWLAPFTLGEAWHNNHHAFPTSFRHGLGRRQFDFSAILIRLMERAGLAWDVVRVSPEKRSAKAVG